ncbi:hypothetical protein, partial [Pseudomonas sp. MWU16-30322]|uniref:hypothetical protein n=1 Tax=Pseudomonas sp. MWU16-30322 TaxID=2878092 RepID=UPI001CF9C287
RLQRLAPLPTHTPESAGLHGYGPGYIVSLSLKSVIGFGSPFHYSRAPHYRSVLGLCFMVAMRGAPSGAPGLLF